MAFHDVRLPVNIEKGVKGGPGFNTTILELSSGFEKRNINWARTRGRWDIGYGIDSKEDNEAVLAFFYARQGRAHSFRFKDWTDFEIGVDATDTPQFIATADGVQVDFQFTRRYVSGAFTFAREVTRLVAGTARVFIDGVEQFADFTVDDDTGVVNFDTAPLNLEVISVICEFDVPVRFDSDQLDLTGIRDTVYDIPGLDILEMRETLAVLS